uniref:Uncharacterized protein n=2 Tax=Caenorhabditis japonica TaxID=281687 RepID=A0A8R1IWS7_CAEJA
MLKGSSHDDDTTIITDKTVEKSQNQRQQKDSERDGLNMTVPDGGASTSTPREAPFGSQTARESSRLYQREGAQNSEERANSARDPPSSMARVPLRRSYRDAGQAMSVEKKEKKVERLFAQPKPDEKEKNTVAEEQEIEEIVSGNERMAA